MRQSVNFLFAGVGGQGTIVASEVVIQLGLAAGYHVKQAEVHGMSQRAGSVQSQVRWGEVVHAPFAGAGEIDVLLAFEKSEALRAINSLRPNALVVINQETIIPMTVTSGHQIYPSDGFLRTAFNTITSRAFFVDGTGIAKAIGNAKVANIVLIGALSLLGALCHHRAGMLAGPMDPGDSRAHPAAIRGDEPTRVLCRTRNADAPHVTI